MDRLFLLRDLTLDTKLGILCMKSRGKRMKKKIKLRLPLNAGKPGGPMKSKKRKLLEKAAKGDQ